MKKLFFIWKLLFISIMTLLLANCDKNEASESKNITVDVKEITFTETSPSKELKVTSSGEWHFEAQGLQGGFGVNTGSTDWYTLTPMFGDNNQIVTITLKEGVTTGKTTSLKIVGKNNTETVSLKFSIQ